MKFVLSVDGGGCKGIIPAHVLFHLSKWVNRPLNQCFDLMGGTSTGGLVIAGVSFLDPEQLLNFYLTNSKNIFIRNWLSFGLTRHKYSAKYLEQFLKETFGNKTLGESPVPLFMFSYDLLSSSPVLLNSWDLDFAHCKVWEASRATTAAPVYFPPFCLSVGPLQYDLIDGGVYLNNPAYYVYHEARKKWPNDDICLISLGTGEYSKSYTCEETKKWGALEWLTPLLSVSFDGQSDVAHRLLEDIVKNDKRLMYFRLQNKLIHGDSAMDNTSDDNLKNLLKDAQIIEKNNERSLRTIVRLMRNKI